MLLVASLGVVWSPSASAIPGPPATATAGSSAISAGYWHTCALTTAGGVKCWGWNQWGLLGNGTLIWNSPVPLDVVSAVPVSALQRVSDRGIAPPAPWTFLSPPRRVDVTWAFPSTNTAPHRVMDASGLGLFDSGLVAPGGSFTTGLFAAGTYPVADPTTGGHAAVLIPVRMVPRCGPTSGSFAIVWASEAAPAGMVYDVRLRRPGSATFVAWRTGVTFARATFAPDAGAGLYVFEARLRSRTGGAAVGWSQYRTLNVS